MPKCSFDLGKGVVAVNKHGIDRLCKKLEAAIFCREPPKLCYFGVKFCLALLLKSLLGQQFFLLPLACCGVEILSLHCTGLALQGWRKWLDGGLGSLASQFLFAIGCLCLLSILFVGLLALSPVELLPRTALRYLPTFSYNHN